MTKAILFILILFQFNKSGAQNANPDLLSEQCKIWGYIKYHLPGYAQAETDLFRLLCNDISLHTLIDELIQTQSVSEQPNSKSPDYYCNISDSWIENSVLLSANDKNKLISISQLNNEVFLHGKSNSAINTFLSKTFDDSHYSFDTSSTTSYFIGIFKLWNHLNYLYPHRCQLHDFDSTLISSINILLDSPTFHGYGSSIRKILASLNDPHTVAFYNYPQKRSLLYQNIKKVLPVNLSFKQGNFVLTDISKKSAFSGKNFHLLAINDEAVSKYIVNVTNLKYGDTNGYRNVINCTGMDSIILKVVQDGKTISKTQYAESFINLESWMNQNFDLVDSIYISKTIPYINLNNIENKKAFEEFKEKLSKYDTVITDLRGYPKNKFSNKAVEYLTPVNDSQASRYLIYPDYKHPGSFVSESVIEKGKYNGGKKIYVVINNFTQSWSETLAMILARNKDVTFLGSPTGNAFGQVSKKLSLPCGIDILTTDIGQEPSLSTTYYPNGIQPLYRLSFINTSEEIIEILIPKK